MVQIKIIKTKFLIFEKFLTILRPNIVAVVVTGPITLKKLSFQSFGKRHKVIKSVIKELESEGSQNRVNFNLSFNF